MTAQRLDRITIAVEQMAGEPCLRSLRIPVATVVGMVADGMSESQILTAYPDLEAEDIRQARLIWRRARWWSSTKRASAYADCRFDASQCLGCSQRAVEPQTGEDRARLFVLTIQTAHWFHDRGLEPAGVGDLPEARRAAYNARRNSKVYVKTLAGAA